MTEQWVGVVRFGGLGDNLIASSVFPALRAKYGRLEVITNKDNAEVFENNPHIDRLIIWPEDEPKLDVVEWQKKVHNRLKELDNLIHKYKNLI